MAKAIVKINDKLVSVAYERVPLYVLKFSDKKICVFRSNDEFNKQGWLARIKTEHSSNQYVWSTDLDTLTRELCLKLVTFAHYYFRSCQK